ncbi:MAG: translocation/assembly module TamB domain-containing protein, partial [Vulcanimicrobiaceae bacterium]
LTAHKVVVGFSITYLIRGQREFGLTYINVVDQNVTLFHHRDGTFNVKSISMGKASKKKAPPWNVRVDISNGSVAMIDEFSAPPKVRRESVVAIKMHGTISPEQPSSYVASMALDVANQRYPITGNGEFNSAAGYESQHWSAKRIPIALLVDFGLPTRALNVNNGELRNLDVRAFGLADKSGTLQTHLGGHVDLEGVIVTAAGLAKPLRDLHGPIAIADDAITFPQMTATIAGVPLFAAGGVYDFSAPTVRIGARISAQLGRLRAFSPAFASRPVSGPFNAQVLAIGPATKPVVFAAFSSPQLAYDKIVIVQPHGLIAMQGADVTILDAALKYGPLQLGARGTVTLAKDPVTTLVANVSGPSDGIPYAAQVVPHMPLRGVAVITGAGRKLNLAGVVDGANNVQRLAGIANVAGNGTGTAGPISIDGPGNSSLLVSVALDRPHDTATIIAATHQFSVRAAPLVTLPGLHVPRMPAISGTLDAGAVAFQKGKGLDYLGGNVGVYGANYNGMSLDRLLAIGEMARNQISAVADVQSDAASFRKMGVPITAGRVEAVADVGGSLKSPSANVSALLDGGKVAKASVFGNVALAYDGGNKLALLHSSVSVGGGFASANGTITDVRSGSPHYDISAQMREADLAVLTTAFGVKLPYPEGRIEANAHVRGSGKSPSVVGDMSIPEASVNMLAFQAQTAFSGDASHIVTHDGKIVFGSTQLTFAADVGKTSKSMTLASRHVDLSDFNDYFPAAETLGGQGALSARLSQSGSAISTRGTVAITGTRFRRFDLGNTYATWDTAGSQINANGFVAGPGGVLKIAGTEREKTLNATASVRDMQLGTWLSAAGINAPILGRVDADATAHGPIRNLTMSANAALTGGLINQIPVQRLTLSMTAANGRGRLVAANFEIPYLSATASGTFGFSPHAPVDLTMHANSPDIGMLAKTVTRKPSPFGGAVDTTLHATGQPNALALDDVIDASRLSKDKFVIPHAHAEIAMKPGSLDVRGGNIAFEKGNATFSAHVPLSIGHLAFHGSSTGSALPINGEILADHVDLAQFATLMPKDTKVGGTLVGQIALSGTDEDPRFDGALALGGGFFSSSQEKDPFSDGTAVLALDGSHVTLDSAHFTVGKKGSIDSHGTFVVPNMRDPLHALSFNVVTAFSQANFNLPKYLDGQLDGTLTASKTPQGEPLFAGNVTVSHTRIPAAGIVALALAKPSGKPPPAIGMNLKVTVGPDVRLQGDGVNVGAAGSIAMSGSLAKPVLEGTIKSTGGTVNLYRDFTIDAADVVFNGTGIIPDVNARATTFLPQPPTDVKLRVSGPATHMNLQLTSNPPHDKGQIIALMIGGPGLAGLNGLQTAQGSTPSFLQGIGQGAVNGMFAKAVMEPLSTGLGSALGMQNVQFNYDVVGQGGFSALLSRRLGPNMSLRFGQTYGFPSRTTIGLHDQLNKDSAAGFSLFSTYGMQGLGYYSPYLTSQPGSNISLQAEQPAAGTQGFGLHYTRYFGK